MTAEPAIRVFALTDNLLCFYAGRDDSPRYAAGPNWIDDSAMALGVATYAVYDGDAAIIYDAFASIAQARWVRRHLEEMGIRKFTLVYSHWHLDHIAGGAVYADCDVVATKLTAAAMESQRGVIETGALWGPPAIENMRFPNVLFDDRYDMRVGDVHIELRRVNIHSIDGCVLYMPKEKILLAGDTLEDCLTYMIEPEYLAEHIRELEAMRTWDIARIYPDHGDPRVIAGGGYDKSFIDATIAYITAMLQRSHDADYLHGTMEDYISDSAARGWVTPFEPYRPVHAQNLKVVCGYWHDKPLPPIAR